MERVFGCWLRYGLPRLGTVDFAANVVTILVDVTGADSYVAAPTLAEEVLKLLDFFHIRLPLRSEVLFDGDAPDPNFYVLIFLEDNGNNVVFVLGLTVVLHQLQIR